MRPEGTQGFTPLEKHWVMERTNAWHGRYRRNSKDEERRVESSTAMRHMSNVHLLLKRLSPGGRPACHYVRMLLDICTAVLKGFRIASESYRALQVCIHDR